jgi:arylsulfatase A-like enzyme
VNSTRPNFVIFLTDDQGYGDLSCMGNTDVHTPYLDNLANEGALLTQWYSNSPVCSPSRASLLTGRYPGNAGVRSILRGHRSASGLSPDVPTLATALKPLGYRSALFGKWHLGVGEGSRPHDHGFERWFGFLAGCIDYYSHIFYYDMEVGTNPIHDLWDNGQEVSRDGEYFTELIAEKAVEFVRSVAREQPFLLYVPFNAPHYPMHAPQKYLDRFPELPPDRRIMAAMLSAMDDGVGRIVAELDARGLRDNTCIFFQSDNGPSRESRNWLDGRTDPYYGGGTCKLKGHKFSLYEGGIRAPALISWPMRIPAGQVLDGIGIAMDIFPTFLAAAGGDPTHYELDGTDVLPMLAHGATSPHDVLYWEMLRQTAVRRGDWKLVLNGQLVEGAPPDDDQFLANMRTDPAETTNLRFQQPELTAELETLAELWRAGIEARWQREWLPRLRNHDDIESTDLRR